MTASLGRAHLHPDTVIQFNTIIAGLADLIRMTKTSSPFVGIRLRAVQYRHQREYAIVAHPGAALMRLAKGADLVRRILVFPAIPILARLRAPSIHGKGQGGGRISIPITQPDR